MNPTKTLLSLLLSIVAFITFAQAQTNYCDSIYEIVETEPQYGQGKKDLLKFIIDDLSPILNKCYSKDSISINKIIVNLTVDKFGSVSNVEFIQIKASENCKQAIEEKLMDMHGWEPGKMNNTPVCSVYKWSIGCIHWRE